MSEILLEPSHTSKEFLSVSVLPKFLPEGSRHLQVFSHLVENVVCTVILQPMIRLFRNSNLLCSRSSLCAHSVVSRSH